jgi:hypothetical protein
MYKAFQLSFLIFLLSLVACGEAGGGSSKKPSVENFRGFSKVEVGNIVKFQSDCYAEKYEDQTVFQKASFEFRMTSSDEADYTLTTIAFGDSKCTIRALVTTIDGSGTLSNSNRKFEVYVDQMLMTPLMSEVADVYNDMELCGFSDWQSNASQDVTTCVEGNLDGDIYINTNASETAVTLYLCDAGAPLNKDCGKISFNRL